MSMDKDKEIEKTEEKKLRDLTPEHDAKGGQRQHSLDRPVTGGLDGPGIGPVPPITDPHGAKKK